MNEYLDLQFEPTEAILVEVAIRIQLPPSRHELAVERYRAISEYAEREGSPLKDLIARFYPQGSMAIRATIASGTSDNDYDIDIVAELLLPESTAPETVLELMFRAIRGEPGSRYFDMTKRRSRCVTVYYADGMHLDITPVVLNAQRSPRTSYLFHDDPDKPAEDSATLLMNAWGFCEWFKSRTHDDSSFASRYAEMSRSLDFEAKADAEPVDPQEDPALKGTDVISLQLIKRFLNLRYEERRGRKPPSVLLSKWVADDAIHSNSILKSTSHHVRLIRKRLSDAERREEVVYESNPACHEDCFTDRWPLSRTAQQQALQDLTEFQNALDQLASGNLSIEETQDLLIELFGDLHVREAVKSIQRSAGREMREGRTRHRSGGGMRVGGAAATSTGRTARRNTYYGGELDEP